MAVRLMRESNVITNQSPNHMINHHIELNELEPSDDTKHKLHAIQETNPEPSEVSIVEMDEIDLSNDNNDDIITREPEIIEVDDITNIDDESNIETADIIEEEEEENKYDKEEEEEEDGDGEEGEVEEAEESSNNNDTTKLPLIWDDNNKIWEYYWKSDGINNVHIGFSCKEMYERNELYFKNSAEIVMFKATYDTEWLSSDEYDIITELIKYNQPSSVSTINKNPFNYHEISAKDGNRMMNGDYRPNKGEQDLEFACCTPMCACCTMSGFLIIFIMELIISTEFEETVPVDGTAELGFWEFDGYFFHFLTILYAVLISITGAFIVAYCYKKLWLKWKEKPKYFCYMISGLIALWLLSAAIIDGAYEAEHDTDIGFVAVFLLIMIFTFCGPICLCCFVLSG